MDRKQLQDELEKTTTQVGAMLEKTTTQVGAKLEKTTTQLRTEIEKTNTQIEKTNTQIEKTNTQLGAKIDALAAVSAAERDNVSALRGASELLLKLVRWYGLM